MFDNDYDNYNYETHHNMIGLDVYGVDYSDVPYLEKAIDFDDLSFLDDKNIPPFDVNMRFKNDYTLLMLATYRCAYNFIDYLLENGADIEAVSDRGSTALHYLCSDFFFDERECILLTFLEHNVNIEARDYDGMNPLLLAAGSNSIGILKILVDAGANVNAKHPSYVNALWNAITNDSYETAKFLFEKDLYSIFNHEQISEMLRFFVSHKDRNIVKTILSKFTFSKLEFDQALFRALVNNDLGMIKELCYAGASVEGNYIFPVVAYNNKNEHILQFFKEKGASFELLKDEKSGNPIIDYLVSQAKLSNNNLLSKKSSDDGNLVSKLPSNNVVKIKENSDFQSILNNHVERFLKNNPDKKSSDIYKFTRLITRQLFYNILKKQGYKPKKDKIIVIAANMQLSYEELKVLLESAGFALSEGNEVDVKVKNAFKNNQYEFIEDLFV